MKRLFDVALSTFGLIAFVPLLLIVALWIKHSSPGPVWYRGIRIGRDGRPFKIWKFRTMVIDADKAGGPSTSDRDPRITSIGLILRRTKLDELPQLINILV